MGRKKLSNDDKQQIRNLHEAGLTISALASQFGVAYVTIKRVVDEKFYAEHLARSVKYNKENTSQVHRQNSKTSRRFSFRLNLENDARIIKVLDAKENASQYIRDLIVADIGPEEEKHNNEEQ